VKYSKAQIAQTRANLQKAPAKEDVGSVRAAIFQMRGELMAALIEKDWTYADLRDWLATQGIEVSLSALQRYLVGVRAARKAAKGEGAGQVLRVSTAGDRAAPARTPPPADPGSDMGDPPRVVPPMPRPIVMPRALEHAERSEREQAPRASSFPIRRDRQEI